MPRQQDLALNPSGRRTPADLSLLREEVARLQRENAVLRHTLAAQTAHGRMLEVARECATRAAITTWPRR